MFGKSFKELLHDRKSYDNIPCSQERYVCLVCGGDGEVINENHALADSDFERRYVICRNCHGIGSIPIKECER